MTQDEIINLAKQAGARRSSNTDKYDVMEITYCGLEAFAKLIAEKEREECANICEYYEDYAKGNDNYHATLIRAKGQE